MEIGFYAPTSGKLATAEGYRALAARGEALGFDHIAVSDHIVIPTAISSTYPYTPSGGYPGGAECLEQLAILAALAGMTSRIGLLTSVMVVPHRPPVQTAKTLASIDVLSGGRLTVGCGAGWMEEEFAALGAPYAARGRATDEYIQAFRELWTSAEPSFEGAHVRFGGIAFEPKPVRKPHPPIWIGGESGPALRRAARFGDGWYPISANPRFPLDSVSRYAARRDALWRLAEEAGRGPDDIRLAYWAYGYRPSPREAADGGRACCTGPAEDVAADAAALKDTGVSCIVFTVLGGVDDVGRAVERLDRFGTEVLPLLRQ